jgi:hypothetical protein
VSAACCTGNCNQGRECPERAAKAISLPIVNPTLTIHRPNIDDSVVNQSVTTWIPVSEPPDDETTVLLFDTEATEPVWPGYRDGDGWRYGDGMIAYPTHWSDLPSGPTA